MFPPSSVIHFRVMPLFVMECPSQRSWLNHFPFRLEMIFLIGICGGRNVCSSGRLGLVVFEAVDCRIFLALDVRA